MTADLLQPYRRFFLAAALFAGWRTDRANEID